MTLDNLKSAEPHQRPRELPPQLRRFVPVWTCTWCLASVFGEDEEKLTYWIDKKDEGVQFDGLIKYTGANMIYDDKTDSEVKEGAIFYIRDAPPRWLFGFGFLQGFAKFVCRYDDTNDAFWVMHAFSNGVLPEGHACGARVAAELLVELAGERISSFKEFVLHNVVNVNTYVLTRLHESVDPLDNLSHSPLQKREAELERAHVSAAELLSPELSTVFIKTALGRFTRNVLRFLNEWADVSRRIGSVRAVWANDFTQIGGELTKALHLHVQIVRTDNPVNVSPPLAMAKSPSDVPSAASLNLGDGGRNIVVLVWDESIEKLFRAHVGPSVHPERPERLTATIEHLKDEGLFDELTVLRSRPATRDELVLAHSKAYVDKILGLPKEAAAREIAKATHKEMDTNPMLACNKFWFPFSMDPDTYVCEGSTEAVKAGVGSVLTLMDVIMDPKSQVRSGFALVRPPGHHAGASQGGGFCLINNVATAARYLQSRHHVERIMIVDFDVHLGDGTYELVGQDEDILFFDVHRGGKTFYPGKDSRLKLTPDAAEGGTISLPLDRGYGDPDLYHVFREILLPACNIFQPNFILVSAGFDAVQRDRVGGCRVSPNCYGWMVSQLLQLADVHCEGKCGLVLEGGYHLMGMASAVASCVFALVHHPLPEDFAIDINPGAVIRLHHIGQMDTVHDVSANRKRRQPKRSTIRAIKELCKRYGWEPSQNLLIARTTSGMTSLSNSSVGSSVTSAGPMTPHRFSPFRFSGSNSPNQPMAGGALSRMTLGMMTPSMLRSRIFNYNDPAVPPLPKSSSNPVVHTLRQMSKNSLARLVDGLRRRKGGGSKRRPGGGMFRAHSHWDMQMQASIGRSPAMSPSLSPQSISPPLQRFQSQSRLPLAPGAAESFTGTLGEPSPRNAPPPSIQHPQPMLPQRGLVRGMVKSPSDGNILDRATRAGFGFIGDETPPAGMDCHRGEEEEELVLVVDESLEQQQRNGGVAAGGDETRMASTDMGEEGEGEGEGEVDDAIAAEHEPGSEAELVELGSRELRSAAAAVDDGGVSEDQQQMDGWLCGTCVDRPAADDHEQLDRQP